MAVIYNYNEKLYFFIKFYKHDRKKDKYTSSRVGLE